MLDKVIALKFTRDEFLGEFKRGKYTIVYMSKHKDEEAFILRIRGKEISLSNPRSHAYPFIITLRKVHIINIVKEVETSDFEDPVIVLILFLDPKYNTSNLPDEFRGSLIYKLEKFIIFDRDGWEENKENLLLNLEGTNLGYILLKEFKENTYGDLWREKM